MATPAARFAGRLTTRDLENSEASPIRGLKHAPSLSLPDCIAYAEECDPVFRQMELRAHVTDAVRFAKNLRRTHPRTEPCTVDEIAAINFYAQESPFYRELNRRLRDSNRQLLDPLFPYLKLLMLALLKLPPHPAMVYRGVKADLRAQYEQGDHKIWWPITSTTSDLGVLSNPMFLGTEGQRTMFHISTQSGVDISRYSGLPESEVILLPGTRLEVRGMLDIGHGAYMVNMVEKSAEGTLDITPAPEHAVSASFLPTSPPPVPMGPRSIAAGKALVEACMAKNRSEALRILRSTSNKPEVNQESSENMTPLQYMGIHGWEDVTEELIGAGAALDAVNENGDKYTALHQAVVYLHAAVATKLLNAKAFVDAPDAGGSTPLHVAAYYGYAAMAELLLSRKANPTALTHSGLTPADCALLHGHTDLAQRLRQCQRSVASK